MFNIPASILSLTSLLVPPVFDFIKKKFLPRSDTQDSTLNTLAVTKPDILAEYTEALSKLVASQTAYYNRDVVGEISRWVSNLRASIRPIFVLLGFGLFCMSACFNWHIDAGIKDVFIVTVNSWFGSRIVK